MSAFKNIPFFRIGIPFITGIVLAIQFDLSVISWVILPLLIFGALIFDRFKQQSSLTKSAFIICTDVFLFCLAANLVNVSNISKEPTYYGHFTIRDTSNKMLVVVHDLPVTKEKFIKCDLRVLQIKTNSKYKNATGKLIGYFKKSNIASQINYGDVLLINSKLIEIEPPKNPFEFDYKTYLSNKQIHYMSFVDSNSFAITSRPSPLSFWWSKGLHIKQYILNSLKNSALSQEAYAISAALLTGYDDDIDSSVMEAFSHSGTLHVLSVSGLHTGLIYVVLSFLFDLIDRKKKYKIGKFIFITCCLWFFALITGFSAPVLRAVIMFNLLGFGKIFFRNDFRNQINILLVSAFMLLCYDPYLITNIGFLLSYFALFGILFFQPVFMNVWQPEKKYQVYLWQSITASFAATLTTLPLTLFYFKQFPFWFFITNLVVVPATFVILLLALFVVLKISKVAIVINAIIKFLIYFIGLFNVPLIGFIDNIHFQLFDTLLLSVLIIALSVAVYYRSYKHLVFSFVILIFWQLNSICVSYFLKSENIFTVYQLKKQFAYSIKSNQMVSLSKLRAGDYNFHVKPHVNSFNYPILNDTAFNFVKYKNKCILILNEKKAMPLCDFREVSTLIISNNFILKPKHLKEFNHLRTIVSDGSNNNYVIKQLAELCSKFDLVFYDTKIQGAYLETL